MGDWGGVEGSGYITTDGQSGTNAYWAAATSSASANTKGDWLEVFSSSPFDANGLNISIGYATEGYSFLLDIGIGAAGSEVVIISNILYEVTGLGTRFLNNDIFFPISIPNGSRVSIRIQSTGGSKVMSVGLSLFSGGWNKQACSLVTTYGAATADSGGTSVDPGGTAHTEGAYTEITAATTNITRGFILASGGQLNTSRQWSEWLVDIAIGGAGSEVVIFPDLRLACESFSWSTMIPHFTQYIPLQIASGQRIAVRAKCSINDATDRLFDVVLYGVS